MAKLAIVQLTKSLLVKAGEKVAAKRKVWAEEGAKSVEETKRREAEFKEDFNVLKTKIDEGTQKAKVEAKKGLEVASKAKEDIKAKIEETTHKGEANVRTEEVKSTVKSTDKKVSTESKPTTQKKKEPKVSTPVKAKTTQKKETNPKEKTTAKKVTTTNSKDAGSKKEAKIALYAENIKKHYGSVDEDFLVIVVNNLGPTIYRKDAELVSCSDPKELLTVRKNFLQKKLGLESSVEDLDAAIKVVCEELKSTRTKYRATFYYALAKNLKQESKLS